MTLDDSEKITVVLAALQERYQVLRTIRDRVQSIGLWALGLLGGAGGWLIQADAPLNPTERFLVLTGLLASMSVLRWAYLDDLERGFSSQQRVAAKLETVLGLYELGTYGSSQDSLYPHSWVNAGTGEGDGHFFASTYRLLGVGTLFLTIVILAV